MMPTYKTSGKASKTSITVIVPARDEEQNIKPLLDAITGQQYPKDLFEVIIVNDHSTDNTAIIAETYPADNVQVVDLAEHVDPKEIAYKKRAVEVAIKQATGNLIVTTDADCVMGPKWLATIADFYQKQQCKFIAAPVEYSPLNGWLDKFQALDFMSIMGVTGATIQNKLYSLSNGANMAYERAAFIEVSGYKDIDKSASGDDVFLMEKMGRKYPNKIGYLKQSSAIVRTQPCKDINALFNQRLRWVSKTKYYSDNRTKSAAILVLLFYVSLISTFILGLIWHQYFALFALQLIVKLAVEFAFVNDVSSFFKQKKLLKYFLPLQLVHFPFMIIVGLLSQFVKYKWKNRKL